MLPATLLTDPDHRKQITDVLRAKGSIDPLILREYIEYLQALGNGASPEQINATRAAALDAEVNARARRSEWLHKQQLMIDSMQIDRDLKHVLRLLFSDEHFYRLPDSAGHGTMEYIPGRYAVALRWMKKDDSVFFNPDGDDSLQYRETKRERRRMLTAATERITTDHSGDADSLIDAVIHSWYLFEEDEASLPPASHLICELKKRKRSELFGGWLTLSAGMTPYNPDVLITPAVNIIGYGTYSVEQNMHDDAQQWYAALRFRWPMKDFIAPMSYIAVDLFGSLGASGITHRLYQQSSYSYSIDGYDYYEGLTFVWERMNVRNIRRIFATITVPLYVPLDNLIFEGGMSGGVQYYQVHIDYWYRYLKVKYIPAGLYKFPIKLYDQNKSEELNSNHKDFVFFPVAVVVWRPFNPVSVQATISTGVWLVRVGLDIL